MSETPASPTLAPSEPTPVVGLTFDSFADCFENASSWLSKSQVFISTDTALPIGSPVSVDVSVVDGTPLIRAFGRVSWVRKQRIRDDQPAGISVGIIHLDTASAALIDAIERCKQNAAAAPHPDVSPSGAHPVEAAVGSPETGDDEASATLESPANELPLDEPLRDELAADGITDAGIDGSGIVEGEISGESSGEEIDVDADVALAVERMEAIPGPTATGATASDAAAGSMVVTASAQFADGLHFGEDGAPGTHPAIATGHELDELTEISFSDVENAVSREIDAAVLRHRFQGRALADAVEVAEHDVKIDPSPRLATEVVLDDDALHADSMIGTGDDHYQAQLQEHFDPDDDDLDDDFDEESEILAPLELALVEVDRTPSATLEAESAPALDETAATPEHDTQAVETSPTEEAFQDASVGSGSISTATISTADLERAAATLDDEPDVADAEMADTAGEAEETGEVVSRSLSTAIISTAALEAAAAQREGAHEESSTEEIAYAADAVTDAVEVAPDIDPSLEIAPVSSSIVDPAPDEVTGPHTETHDTAPVLAVSSETDAQPTDYEPTDHESEAPEEIDLSATAGQEIEAAAAEAGPEEVTHLEATDLVGAQPADDANDETLDEAGEREARFKEASPISDAVEISAQEMAASLLAASRDETNDTQPTAIPEEESPHAEHMDVAGDTGTEDIGTQEINFEDLSATGDHAAAAARKTATRKTAAAAGVQPDRVHPQPGYDPWDLDVSSFIDDALQERRPVDRTASTEVMPPPDMRPDAPATSPAEEQAASVVVLETDEPRPYSSDDSTITVLPRASKEEDDTLGYGPPRTPVAPPDPFAGKHEPELPIAVPPPVSEHPEAHGALPESYAEDKTLSFHKLDQLATPSFEDPPEPVDEDSTEVTETASMSGPETGTAPATPQDARIIAAMDEEPDFGTMAAQLEMPASEEAETVGLAEETARITLPTNEIRAAVAAAAGHARHAAEAQEPEPSAFEETAKLPTVRVPPSVVAPPEEAQPTPSRSGYYARAGAPKRRSTGLGLLAAVFCVGLLALALIRTGVVDNLSTWTRETFPSDSGEQQVADLDNPAQAPPLASSAPAATRPGDASAGTATTDPVAADPAPTDPAPTGAAATVAGATDDTGSPRTPETVTGTAASAADASGSGSASATPSAGTAAGGTRTDSTGAGSADPQITRQALRATVEGWAAAWSNQDPDAYLAFYDATYETPDGLARAAWDDQRRTRLRAPRSLTVRTSELEVESVAGDQATVRFFQSYRANTAGDMRNLGTWKRFDLVRRANGWRIVRESLVR